MIIIQLTSMCSIRLNMPFHLCCLAFCVTMSLLNAFRKCNQIFLISISNVKFKVYLAFDLISVCEFESIVHFYRCVQNRYMFSWNDMNIEHKGFEQHVIVLTLYLITVRGISTVRGPQIRKICSHRCSNFA